MFTVVDTTHKVIDATLLDLEQAVKFCRYLNEKYRGYIEYAVESTDTYTLESDLEDLEDYCMGWDI